MATCSENKDIVNSNNVKDGDNNVSSNIVEDDVNEGVNDENSTFDEDFLLSDNLRKTISNLRAVDDKSFKKLEISDEYKWYLKKYENDSKNVKHTDGKTAALYQNDNRDVQMMEFNYRWNPYLIKNFEAILEHRKSLPIYSQKKKILDTVQQHRVIIIDGDAGCGKTTQVPQYILDSYIESGRGSLCKIACLQTKRISTIAVAERVMYERYQKYRPIQEIGYHVRLEKSSFKKQEAVLYCTTGILLMELRHNPDLNGYSHIIIDDVQTHNIIIDFLLIHIKEILMKDRNLKIILMGAKIKVEEFSKYFDFLESCPVVKIKAKTFHVECFYLEDMIQVTGYVEQQLQLKEKRVQSFTKSREYIKKKPEYLKSLAKKYNAGTISALVKWDENYIDLALIVEMLKYLINCPEPNIANTKKPSKGAKIKNGSILIFLPGWPEIEKLYRLIKNEGENTSKYYIIPLHSKTSVDARREIFMRAPPGKRKVILSTTIAETSITIEDCTIVIDSGKLNMMNYDPTKDLNILKPHWISKSNMHQRRGRAGRTMKGICYHMFTRLQEEFLDENSMPEMQHCNLESSILNTKLLTTSSVSEHLAKAIYPPKQETIDNCLKILKERNILTEDEKLTSLGFLLAQVPADICIGKLLLYGAIFSCLDPILSIAACSAFHTPFISPSSPSAQAEFEDMLFDLAKNFQCDKLIYAFALEKCDHFNNGEVDDRERKFFSDRTVTLLMDLKYQFCDHLKRLKLVNVANPTAQFYNKNSKNKDLIKAIICASFYPNVAKVDPERCNNKEVTEVHNILMVKILNTEPARVSPVSINAFISNIKTGWLAFQTKQLSTKLYIHETTAVNVASIILFGIKLQVEGEDEKEDVKRKKGKEKVDKECVLIVDEFLRVKCSRTDINLIMKLKQHFDNLMLKLISKPKEIDWTRKAKGPDISVLRCIVEFIA